MARYDKYTLGTDLRNLSRDVLRLVQRANSEEDRVGTLKELHGKAEELKAADDFNLPLDDFRGVVCLALKAPAVP